MARVADAQSAAERLAALARAQGVSPVTNPEKLLGTFWPKDETADELIEAVKAWRRADDRPPS
jgi:hypothetical protein